MGKTPRRSRVIRLGLLAAVTLAVQVRARAACTGSTDFGQLTPSCGSGTSYCYVISPGFNTPGSIASAFWSLHAGNSVVGSGTDNGSWAAPDAWLLAGTAGNWLNGMWSSSPGIDGCINGQIPPGKPAEIMVAGFADADVFGAHAYFAVAAIARHAAHVPQFDFSGGVGRDIELKPIPRTAFSRFAFTGYGAWRAYVIPPVAGEVAAGFYGDGSTSVTEAVTGYRVYKRDTLGGAAPTDRHRSVWTPVTGVVPLGQPTSFDYFCLGQIGTYFANTLVFDGGFETDYVSANSLPIKLCLDCRDDLDGDGWSDGDMCGHDDCNDDDPTIYPGAPEFNDGKDNQCIASPGFGLIDEISGAAGFYHPADTTWFTWLGQDGATQYEVARSGLRDFSGNCLAFTTTLPNLRDPDIPQAGGVFYYLVRATAPHAGSWGADSSGIERTVVCDPDRSPH
jgi:hypothetical protein